MMLSSVYIPITLCGKERKVNKSLFKIKRREGKHVNIPFMLSCKFSFADISLH